MSRAADILAAALANPDAALVELDRIDCRESLIEFTKRAWPALEPGNKFITGWAIEAVAEHLEAVTRGEIKRLLINIPPGFSKSMLTNVFWPAWEWGPRRLAYNRFISTSYDKNLAIRDLVRCRDLIKSEWYQERWPLTLKGDSDGKEHYANDKTGWRVARSVGSGLTGWRGDRIVVDDPHSVKTAESEAERATALRWFTETLSTRYNDQSKSALVVIMQRLHEADISGHILEKLRDKYTCLVLPMEHEMDRRCKTTVVMRSTGKPFEDPRTEEGELLFPGRFPRDAVDELKQTLSSHGGSYAVSGQLQQAPVPREGGRFKCDMLNWLDASPKVGKRVRGWDLAATEGGGSWTVGLKLLLTPDKRLIIEDVVRFQKEGLEVENRMLATAKADGRSCAISIPQDPGQAGKVQKTRFAQLLNGFNVHFSPESGEKKDRAIPIAAQVEAGNVWVVRGPWNDALLAELRLWPGSTYLDQGDALSRAHAYLLANPGLTIGLEPGQLFSE